jgi:hypothetical protein
MDYLRRIHRRYEEGSRAVKKRILDEFCQVTRYHRKYALRLLNSPLPPAKPRRRHRRPTYSARTIGVLRAIWEAANYPWSLRLKALLPAWLPWARTRLAVPAFVEQQLLRMSPRQIDRRLRPYRQTLKKRLYGRTKPGTLLKHHIPLKTSRWRVRKPGYTEIDLVAHCGNRSDGEFVHSLNLTDIHTTWVETRAVLGKARFQVRSALEDIRAHLPFALHGIDSDNGSEFINDQLLRYCRERRIQFTRGRPYKKDDNAHVEQKNWTHVRKLMGYVRYDSLLAVQALNALYTGELRLLQNLFLPSVKLRRKQRVGSRIRRYYDAPQTPFERLKRCAQTDPKAVAELEGLRQRLDPFALAESIDRQLKRIYALASHPAHSKPSARQARVRQPLEQLPPDATIEVYQSVRPRVTFQMAR